MLNIFKSYLLLGRAIRLAASEPQVRGLLRLTITLIVGFSVLFMYIEGWSFLDSVYFSTVTMATVGYGDIHPVTAPGKAVTIVFIFMGIGIFVAAVGALAEAIIRHLRALHASLVQHGASTGAGRKG